MYLVEKLYSDDGWLVFYANLQQIVQMVRRAQNLARLDTDIFALVYHFPLSICHPTDDLEELIDVEQIPIVDRDDGIVETTGTLQYFPCSDMFSFRTHVCGIDYESSNFALDEIEPYVGESI